MKPGFMTIEEYMDMVVKRSTADRQSSAEACAIEGPLDPCSIVIFGATGDLTTRKLAPALYGLFLSVGLPAQFFIVGAARTEMDQEQFRDRIRAAVTGLDLSRWDDFAARLYYQAVQFDSPQSFEALAALLKSLAKKHGTGGNKILYLAVPPSLYPSIARMLGLVGLSAERTNGNGWSRIVVEKPFGCDLQSAVALHQALHESFHENQIFRIDHYLAKETVQNVLVFRFANAIFEPLWNRMFIERIHISAIESVGVANRGAYYEEAGVLRDMFQNHMMQLLAVTAMEPPSRFEAEPVRDETMKVFRSLRPFPADDPSRNLILGQYGPGVVGGVRMRAYREETAVDPDSLTPTFAAMVVFVDNWRWQGVPFFIASGKALARKLTEIVIYFRQVPHSMFLGTLGEEISPNRLIIGIYPDEKINLTFEVKNPGARVCLRSVIMDFSYDANYSGPKLDAYQKALLDCIQGDQMLFWREDAVERCWAFLDPVLLHCETCYDRQKRLLPYEGGSWGPGGARLGTLYAAGR